MHWPSTTSGSHIPFKSGTKEPTRPQTSHFSKRSYGTSHALPGWHRPSSARCNARRSRSTWFLQVPFLDPDGKLRTF
ncbi:hypothetical protein Y1Q_0001277 [Alligator mississippiensis]|uniref:Uncharacterized protein n=1 Tax=Alligator mississippiensis TaxID=8496 RepID=A0A151M8W9_ALLMI|nr:hypothetical protein Y1Q_0001277 [Alligator mississippiensis]